MNLEQTNEIIIQQRFELAELLDYETRNKYEILDSDGMRIFFAAEQQKGVLGFLLRQFLGHWRTFEIHFFDNQRNLFVKAVHPFRFYFNRLEIFDSENRFIGAIERRFSFLSKKFDVLDANGQVVLSVSSPIWRIWTFKFLNRQGNESALIEKKWGGLLTEAFTDGDRFKLTFSDESLGEDIRKVLMAAALFIDLMYFEKKG